jgi:3-deoxy-manno-octulosonate cytidylyltransferase (CMP-KDO synthetase)
MKIKKKAKKTERVLGIIPARLKSTRLPEKMLALIDGKPLIYYTWRQAKQARLLDALVVATDSAEIFEAVRAFGGEAIMTSDKHQSGSDRVAEATRKFKKFLPDIVVNIQGDEPLISPEAIDAAASLLIKKTAAVIGTIATPVTNFKDIRNPSLIKTIIQKDGRAIYFSRSVIPHPRFPYENYLRHLGIYAFRRETLRTYVSLSQTPLECAEGLEQLRALEHGIPIHIAVGKFESMSVDTPADLARVRKIITAGVKKGDGFTKNK